MPGSCVPDGAKVKVLTIQHNQWTTGAEFFSLYKNASLVYVVYRVKWGPLFGQCSQICASIETIIGRLPLKQGVTNLKLLYLINQLTISAFLLTLKTSSLQILASKYTIYIQHAVHTFYRYCITREYVLYVTWFNTFILILTISIFHRSLLENIFQHRCKYF